MSSLALFGAFLLAGATPDRLPPIDQCGSDASFQRFRSELARAVQRRDRAALLRLVDDDVQIDFGGGSGRKAFVAAWKLDKPGQSRLWNELRTLLQLGCVKGEGGYLMPSLFEQVGDDMDSLETYVAVVPGAPLRSAPRADAPVVATLYWDVLKLEEVSDDQQWSFVSTKGGRRGYVRLDQIRNPLDSRLLVVKTRGEWRIKALVAGD